MGSFERVPVFFSVGLIIYEARRQFWYSTTPAHSVSISRDRERTRSQRQSSFLVVLIQLQLGLTKLTSGQTASTMDTVCGAWCTCCAPYVLLSVPQAAALLMIRTSLKNTVCVLFCFPGTEVVASDHAKSVPILTLIDRKKSGFMQIVGSFKI